LPHGPPRDEGEGRTGGTDEKATSGFESTKVAMGDDLTAKKLAHLLREYP
jgi:hypothetical protein